MVFKEFIGSVKSVGRYIAQNPIKSAALGALAITGAGAAAYGLGMLATGGSLSLPGGLGRLEISKPLSALDMLVE
tara:strand:+ start:234 stop:458 length:225 start_codon:yes stop_codon:yes gene_type:complete